MDKEYRICKKCIMDTTDPDITFDEQGVCNHCYKYEERKNRDIHYDEAGQQKLARIVEKIKSEGRDKEYDCLIGVSGGVDSTTVAYRVKKLGLRPLAIHLDNGWDSELAVSNIEKILRSLDIDLFTYVLDWEEFKDLQLSFLKASVPNCEIPTDHAITALLYHQAAKRNIKYIITGGNVVTEAILPLHWGYYNQDWRHIKAIHKRFGTVKLKSFYHLTLFNWVNYIYIKGIKWFPLLNYQPYVKEEAKKFLLQELGWRDYGGKHYESIYTRFYQGYILAVKFGFDKRRAHLATLISAGQITREEALREMQKSPYLSEEMLKQDRDYVIKKLGLTEEEFEKIMSLPVKVHTDYPSNAVLYDKLRFFVNLARKIATHN